MNPQESALINELFDRVAQSSGQQRDQQAERLIESKIASTPHAPYVLAQSTIILQQAVIAAQAKIAALEKQVAEAGSQAQGGSFLSGVANLFGPPQTAPTRSVVPPPVPAQVAAPQGGGFLQNAMATAAGVAGGALLFQGIENLMGHGGGFGGGLGGGNQPTEVVNNYYTDGSNDPSQNDGYNVADNYTSDFDGDDGGGFGGDA